MKEEREKKMDRERWKSEHLIFNFHLRVYYGEMKRMTATKHQIF